MIRTPASPNLAPDSAGLSRLVAGVHHDPHSILGAHEYGAETVIRALRPHALQVVALIGGRRYPMSHIGSGVFAVALPFTGLADYRLETSYPGAGGQPHVHTAVLASGTQNWNRAEKRWPHPVKKVLSAAVLTCCTVGMSNFCSAQLSMGT